MFRAWSELDYTTATAANALGGEALDGFLAGRHDGRLATLRPDGWPHVTPVWFLWQERVFRFSLGASRLHLLNLRGDNRATFCVGEDLERDGSGRGTIAAVAFGHGTVTTMEDDEAFVFVARGETAARVRLKLGLEDSERVEVLDGLAVGDEVIISGQAGLKDGGLIERVTPTGAPVEASAPSDEVAAK